jgi:capsular polysaccharide biosynthesis protein
MAADLANTTADIFQEKIGDILPVESVTILSTAVPTTDPIFPNIPMNLFGGLLLGFLLGLLHVFFKTLLDQKVRNDEIISNLGWTNLGSIVEMSDKEVEESILSESYNQDSSLPRNSRIKN